MTNDKFDEFKENLSTLMREYGELSAQIKHMNEKVKHIKSYARHIQKLAEEDKDAMLLVVVTTFLDIADND
jgi:prefoldin subunit 5